MLPVGECGVIQGKTLEQFNIGCEGDSDMGSLNQIMTEQRLLGKTATKNLVKCRDVINRFTVEDRFAQQILLRVGHSRAVRICSLSVREDSCKSRRRGARQCDADARLNDREAAASNPALRIDLHAVQRMRDRLDHA